jgi:hypothetical protein
MTGDKIHEGSERHFAKLRCTTKRNLLFAKKLQGEQTRLLLRNMTRIELRGQFGRKFNVNGRPPSKLAHFFE